MIFGYLFETFLGFSFALGIEFICSTPSRESDPRWRKLKAALLRGCTVFFDCAIYFAASVQIACVVVLVRKDFGISANGLGGLTVQITWAVALLSLLPLLYPLLMLGIVVSRASEKELEEAECTKSRHEFRFYLFCICWCLFLYTFISRMIGDYAPSQVGEGAGEGGVTVITADEWDTLTNLCLTGVPMLSDKETTVMESFGAAGSIILSLFVICPFIWTFVQIFNLRVVDRLERYFSTLAERKTMRSLGSRALLLLIPLLTIPEIWGVFRVRNAQQALSGAIGNEYTDNQWTFGQVVAVVIFAPVVIEVGYISTRPRD